MSTADRLAAIRAKAATLPHGTRARYIAEPCRCMLCRAANSRYQTERDALIRSGQEPDRLVSTEAARLHIAALSKIGIGQKVVAAASGVSLKAIVHIIAGKRKNIRLSTSKRLLAVDETCRADNARIPADETFALIDELLEGGFTKTQLAKLLGYSRALQFRNPITVGNAAKVRRLYNRLQSGVIQLEPRPDSRLQPEEALGQRRR